MDLTALTSLAGTLIGALSSPAAAQFEQWSKLAISALPGIQSGIVSATPFFEAGAKLLMNGGQPVADADWVAQMALLQAQVDTVDAQVAKDELAQPGV